MNRGTRGRERFVVGPGMGMPAPFTRGTERPWPPSTGAGDGSTERVPLDRAGAAATPAERPERGVPGLHRRGRTRGAGAAEGRERGKAMARPPSDSGTGAHCEGSRGSLTVFVSERQLERVFQQGLQHAVGGRQERGIQRERPRHGRWGLPAAAGRGQLRGERFLPPWCSRCRGAGEPGVEPGRAPVARGAGAAGQGADRARVRPLRRAAAPPPPPLPPPALRRSAPARPAPTCSRRYR